VVAPHVSIAFSAYNEGDSVARTVAAILRGTDYPSFDLIVHDDGSDDGCCDALPGDSRLRVVRSERRHGVGGGKKIAIEACDGPLLLVMDCHVAPAEPGWLRRLVDVTDELDSRAVLSPIIVPLDAATWRVEKGPRVLTHLKETFHVKWAGRVEPSRRYCEVSALRGAAKLMSRGTYEAMGGFDDSLSHGGEEADVSMRAWMAGYPSAYVPASVLGHLFKARSPFPRTYADATVSRLSVAYKCLEEENYARVLRHNRDFFGRAGPWGPEVIRRALASIERRRPELDIARGEVRRRSIRPAEWVLERFAISL